MAKYTSRPAEIKGRTPAEISARFDDLTKFSENLDRIPESERQAMGNIQIEPHSVSITAPQVGEIMFRIIEHTPEKIVFTAEGAPLPMEIKVSLKPQGECDTLMTTVLDIDIPVMLRPLIGGALQKAVDKFADMMVKIAG